MLNWLIYLIIFGFSILCFIVSFQFYRQKWGNLIAGYNDLSKDQKASIDFKTVSRSASKCSFSAGVYMLFMLLFLYSIFENTIKTSYILILFILVSLVFFVFIVDEARKSSKFYRKKI